MTSSPGADTEATPVGVEMDGIPIFTFCSFTSTLVPAWDIETGPSELPSVLMVGMLMLGCETPMLMPGVPTVTAPSGLSFGTVMLVFGEESMPTVTGAGSVARPMETV